MTPVETPATISPWLSAWFSPRDTITRLIATNPRRHVLLLASLGAIMVIALQAFSFFGWTTTFLDWRVITAVVVIGIVAGVLNLFLFGLLLKWSGRCLGGRASLQSVQAALAWGTMPVVVGVPVCFAVLAGLMFFGFVPTSKAVLVLQALFAIPGLWMLISMLLTYSRVQNFGFWRTIISSVAAYLLLLAIPLAIRAFAFQPFDIPSGSMIPTLLVGDYFFVTKYSYGYSGYSFLIPRRLFSGRIFASEPQRGDVVVFRLPKDDSIEYVKRIVGLPGDRVQMINGVLQINGHPVQHEQIDDFVDDSGHGVTRVKRYRETLPNGVSYTTIDLTSDGFYDNTPVYTVPSGHYFMMGDNTDNSTDSRVLSQVGYVPFDNLIGRVTMVFLSINREAKPASIRFERIGSWVH